VLLILFRHGIAIDRGNPACPREEDRFLTDEGVKRTEAAARGLARLGLHPGQIMSSPWLRARQTAEIAARALDFDEDRIEITAVRQVLVTGHAPHLDEVLDEVVGIGGYGGTRLKKAGAAAVEFTVSSPGAGRLEWFIPPRALRALGDT
jgi:phosphohistidine phosphatase